MVDARLPARWLTDPRMDALSDRAWRTWTGTLMLGAEQMTDGVIGARSTRFVHPDGVTESVLDELVDADLVERASDGGFAVVDWVRSGQELGETVRKRLDANRAKQQAYRDRQRDSREGDVTGHVTGDVPGRRDGHDGGEARRGEERRQIEVLFARAWQHWPKKVERKQALERFVKATKRLPVEELVSAIIRFGDAYAATTEPQFVPALGVWLNRDRWTDQLPGSHRGQQPGRPDPDAWMNR